MGQSELFSYLSAFVTIVLAIAVTDMIQSTHRLIRGRHRVKWDALPLVFAAIIAVAVISEFFSIWGVLAITHVSLLRLLWMLAVPTIFALLAYSVLPDEIPAEGLDLTAFYFSERRVWSAIFAAATLFDMARSIERLVSHGNSVMQYFEFIWVSEFVGFVGAATMFFARSRRWSWVGVLLLAGAVLSGTIGWTIRAKAGA